MRKEQGYPGHFCAAKHCLFRRNTLINNKYIVSTVGDMRIEGKNGPTEVGLNRMFETMVFDAIPCDCGCGVYVIKDGQELDYMPADTAPQADQRHEAMCDKWEKE